MSTKLFATNNLTVGTIPFTDNLKIDRVGNIAVESTGKVLKKFKKDDGWYVNLPIVGHGNLTVKVATLTSIVFKGYKLDWKLWNKIELHYADDNVYNVDPDNLAHRLYPEEFHYLHEGIKYKFIPGFSRYGISEDGIIYNTKTGNLLKGSKDTDGYTVIELITDVDGKANTTGRHRYLGLAYKEYSKDVDKLHINHIDHTPSNDWLDNLEWMTVAGNINHSYYQGGKFSSVIKPTVVYDISTKKLHTFESMAMACREFNLVPNNLHRHLANRTYPILQGHYRIIELDDSEVLDMNHPIVTTPVTIKDYLTQGRIYVYNTDNELVTSVDNLIDLIPRFNLNYSGGGPIAKKFKRGINPILKDHVVKVRIPGLPDYLGGELPLTIPK